MGREERPVAIIIPHFGDDLLLTKCLKSIEENCPEVNVEQDVYVFYNNPPSVNTYFTFAVNEMLHKALISFRYCYLYFWILNNDVRIEKDCLYYSIKCFQKNIKCGIVGHKNLSDVDRNVITWAGSIGGLFEEKHKSGFVNKGDWDVATKEKYIAFSSAIIKRQVFEKIGLLDYNLKMLLSDGDFCLRARNAGYECWYEPKSQVLHTWGASYLKRIKTDVLLRNQLQSIFDQDSNYFIDKWGNGMLFAKLDNEEL